MKSLFLSVSLFAVMLFGIVGNYFYINRVADHMNEQLDGLPDIENASCIDTASGICSYWEKQVDTVGLSVDYKTLDHVSEQCALLLSCASCKDVYGYQTAIALLRDAIEDMRRLERFSIGNLL